MPTMSSRLPPLAAASVSTWCRTRCRGSRRAACSRVRSPRPSRLRAACSTKHPTSHGPARERRARRRNGLHGACQPPYRSGDGPACPAWTFVLMLSTEQSAPTATAVGPQPPPTSPLLKSSVLRRPIRSFPCLWGARSATADWFPPGHGSGSGHPSPTVHRARAIGTPATAVPGVSGPSRRLGPGLDRPLGAGRPGTPRPPPRHQAAPRAGPQCLQAKDGPQPLHPGPARPAAAPLPPRNPASRQARRGRALHFPILGKKEPGS